jgi:SAM-dependent methyltransferase
MTTPATWSDYYEQNDAREPREMLLRVLDGFGPGAYDAVDLGCGSGIDTLAMLARGWTVLAADAEQEAIERLRSRITPALRQRLTAVVSPMEDVVIPPSDLVWAGYSTFFCPPDRFPAVWSRIRSAVRPSGRFAGQILGDRDTWAGDDATTWFTRDGAQALFDGWTIERFDEEDEDGEACSGPKHWHVFHVVARAPGPGP